MSRREPKPAPVVVVNCPQADPDYECAAEAATAAVSLLPAAVGGLMAAAARVMAETDATIVASHIAAHAHNAIK